MTERKCALRAVLFNHAFLAVIFHEGTFGFQEFLLTAQLSKTTRQVIRFMRLFVEL